MAERPRLLRITTASISLKLLLRGQITFFQRQGFEVLTVSADGPEVNDLLSEGISHQVVPMTRIITPFQDVMCLWQLIQVIRKFKPDIVHTHTPKAGLLGMMAAWMCSVPVRMHTVAGLPLMEAKGVKRMVLKLTERITYACAGKVYPNSLGLLDYIIREFGAGVEGGQLPVSGFEFQVDEGKGSRLRVAGGRLPGDGERVEIHESKVKVKVQRLKFKVIGRGSSNGIDSDYFLRTEGLVDAGRAIRERYQIPGEAMVFSFVGRVVRDKGIVELVEAFKKLAAFRDARLILVGPYEQELDPLPEEVLQFIQQDKRVIAAGYQHDVRPWMIASDVFVFPSYREGFPNVVMQAACLEVPCIVSDINGCNEIIEDKVSGLIVPVKEAGALHHAMGCLATDRKLRKAFASKAREFVVSNFDQQFVWRELLREYRGLLE